MPLWCKREAQADLDVDRHVPPKPSHSILNTGALRSTHLRVHHVCGAKHAVFLRANTNGSKREHAIREFIGARPVVDVLPPRVVLVLVINSWFTLYGYTIPFNLFIIAWWFGVFANMTEIKIYLSRDLQHSLLRRVLRANGEQQGVVCEACFKRCLFQVCVSWQARSSSPTLSVVPVVVSSFQQRQIFSNRSCSVRLV